MNTIERKQYNWRKSWVRPYESVFSIFLNFCKVNVLNGNNALRLLGIKCSGYTMYIPELMMYNNNTSSFDYNRVLRLLAPNWYFTSVSIFQNLHSWEAKRLIYTDKILYCPICLQSGYHSVLFQIAGARNCPFHPSEQLQKWKLTHWQEYTIDGIKVTEEDYDSFANAKNIILPCFRKKISFLSSSFSLKKITNFSLFAPYYDGWPVIPGKHTFDYLSGKTPSDVIRVETVDIEYRLFSDRFYHWFNSHNFEFSFWYNHHVYHVTEWDYYKANIIDHFLFAKFQLLLSAEDKHISSSAICRIASKDFISYKDIAELKILFIWLIKDAPDIYSAIKARWLIYPSGSDNHHRFYLKNYRTLSVDNFRFCTALQLNETNEVDEYIILMYIISDYIDTLWEEFYKLACDTGGINPMDRTLNLNCPEYYVSYNENLAFYEIYKYID